MTLSEYFSTKMLDAYNFTDEELNCILHLCGFHGLDSMYTNQSFRNPEYHCLTADSTGKKLVKCSLRKGDRILVSREDAIKELDLETRYSLFRKPEVIDPNVKVLDVYCSGAPNYFIYGVTDKMETYSLVSNQYWIRSSSNLTSSQIDDFTSVAVNQKVRVN